MEASTTNSIPMWKASADWFDVCKCNIPCPCTYAQTPSYGDCEGVMAYHIKKGQYGETSLDGLNVLALDYFKGNICPTVSAEFESKYIHIFNCLQFTILKRL